MIFLLFTLGYVAVGFLFSLSVYTIIRTVALKTGGMVPSTPSVVALSFFFWPFALFILLTIVLVTLIINFGNRISDSLARKRNEKA